MSPIQLSLFPARGFALQVFGDLLTGNDGLPSVKPTRGAARALAKRSAVGESAWWMDVFEIVPVEVHEDNEGIERPMYVVIT